LGSADSGACSIRAGSPVRAASRRARSIRLLARARDLRGSRLARGQVGEVLGDRPRRDHLRGEVGHVDDVALPAPVHELLDELVELRRPQDADRPSRLITSTPVERDIVTTS
jgi:hypothetical protein